MSLPNILGITADTIPAEVPYIRPDQELTARWRDRLLADPGY